MLYQKELEMPTTQEIYDSTIEADKAYVDAVFAEINTEITRRVEANEPAWFDYDMEALLGELPVVQQNRIKDQVILNLRSGGIRATTAPYHVTYVAGTPECLLAPYLNLHVRWINREGREFMKTYM